MAELVSPPGVTWLKIVSRPTLQAFSLAFSAEPILEAVVARVRMAGVTNIYDFFQITRAMYDHIAFVHEIQSATRTCLEWDGVFEGKAISGATILAFNATGAIERIKLFHFPYDALNAFSAELRRRRTLQPELTHNLLGVPHENDR